MESEAMPFEAGLAIGLFVLLGVGLGLSIGFILWGPV